MSTMIRYTADREAGPLSIMRPIIEGPLQILRTSHKYRAEGFQGAKISPLYAERHEPPLRHLKAKILVTGLKRLWKL